MKSVFATTLLKTPTLVFVHSSPFTPVFLRDEGCMRFDPIPVVERLFSEWVMANNGQYFPLLQFGPHQKPAASMAKYVTVRPDAEIVVPSFPALFQEDAEAKYGMMFRFRPTSEALADGEKAFVCRCAL